MGRVDLASLLDALGALAEATSAESLADAVLASAVATVKADSAVVAELRPMVLVRSLPHDFLAPTRLAAFEELHRNPPWPLADRIRDGEGGPLRVSDLVSRRRYRNLAIYREVFSLLDGERQVAFTVAVAGCPLLCVAVNRRGTDFTTTDLERLDALRRALSPHARRILDRSPPSPAVDHRGGLRALSRREVQVLCLVARGCTDNQVGRDLGISPRTVNKHLEHIFAKVGARNRTEAALVWHQGSNLPADPLLPAHSDR